MEKMLSNPLFFSVVVAALVSALVTFLLNIFLERYKFKNQYRQIYSDRRLRAYEELHSTLFIIIAQYGFLIKILVPNQQETKIRNPILKNIPNGSMVQAFKDLIHYCQIVSKSMAY